MVVFVRDKAGKPLMPCSEKRAKKLLDCRRARVHRISPFVIRLVDRKQTDCQLQELELKIDPGSKVTGIALARVEDKIESTGEDKQKQTLHALALFELQHRGALIKKALEQHAGYRRRRRSKNLRYRPARFDNRTRKKGWLAPSLQHRVDTTIAWVNKIKTWAPLRGIAQELVRFDTQLMQNSEIKGVEYQQGTLQGYEVREYLLEKFQRQCAYCNAKNIPLEIEHIVPKSAGGSNRISNLALACHLCNQKKGSLPIQAFVKNPLKIAKILAQAKAPL